MQGKSRSPEADGVEGRSGSHMEYSVNVWRGNTDGADHTS